MSKLMKFIGRFFAVVVDMALICIIALAFLVRTYKFQTFLAQQATSFLSSELGTKMKVDEVAIVFFNRVALKGVYVEDENGEVLADIKTLHVKLKSLDLARNKLTISSVELDNGDVHIQRAKSGDYNYWFIQDYFDSGTKTSTSKPIAVDLTQLKLSNVHFRFDDNRKTYSDFGMDWDHLDFINVNLFADNINIRGNDIFANIKNLATEEKCGFVLDKLTGKAAVTSKGIYFNELTIKTPLSDVSFERMNLKMNQLPDVYTFEDSVVFEATLRPSLVSLKDVSYFASALEGMDQMVVLSGVVSRRVKNLHVADLNLRTGKKTQIKGTINLPDFRNLDESFFNEKLDYTYINLNELKQIKLPKDNGGGYMTFDKYAERLGYLEGENVKLTGFMDNFVVAANKLTSQLGTVRMDNGVKFSKNYQNNSYAFNRSIASTYDVKVEEFDLGTFLQDDQFGIIDGTFFLSGEANPSESIKFTNIEGEVSRFDFMDYSYKKISIKEGSLIDKVLVGKVDVKDDNLNLVYDGSIDLKGQHQMQFTVDLTRAALDNLGFTNVNNSKLESKFIVNLTGTNETNISGNVELIGFIYSEKGKNFKVPNMTIDVTRGPVSDLLLINSELGVARIEGKIDFAQVSTSFQSQLSQILPTLFEPPKKTNTNLAKKNNFTYSINTEKKMNDFLDIFVPGLYIKPGTKVSGGYSEATNDFSMVLESSLIKYEYFQFHNVFFDQSAIDKDVKMKVDIGEFYLNDTLSVAHLSFNAVGSRDTFQTQLTWNPNTTNYSEINWQTAIIDEESIDFLIQPSLISIHQKQWDIKNASALEYRQDYISIKDFLFERKNQFISLNGKVSDRDEDKLKIKMSHLQLDDFTPIIKSPVALNGELNGFGEISTPFTNLGFNGDASIKGLFIDQEEVGDVFVQSNWEKGKQSIGLKGDLIYKNTQTFAFDGFYHLNRTKDVLDFNLVFDDTDIQFTNAFMDPQVVSDIEGTLNGKIKVKGTLDKPLLSGGFDLENGGAKIGILGVKFRTNGEIYCDEYGFYMDNIPIFDQEGNAGSLVGSIYQDNFLDWNFDLAFNLEDDAVNKDPIIPWKAVPLNKFLVMNTSYQEGDSYYGKVYMTGYANIFGYAEHLEITVDAKTEKGTTINFPMYGTSEISADEDFITFTSADSSLVSSDPKIDFTGVDLNLNFDVTPDAKLKIIFDEKLGDEIVTDGSGKISMRVDNLGDISLDGTYTVNEGVYNFAMGPIKQNFFIEQGGYITWTGDPYNANLNLRSYYKTKANLSEISVDQIGNSTGTNQDVLCYLDITQTLVKPAIAFDIEVPNADESGKALINRIKSDPEELNRQFFSLLLVKSFQPLKGSNTATSGTALDLAANQINSMLSQLSQSYKLAVNMDANSLGDKTYELGLSKEFLDNRLILSGSFGVENSTATKTSSSQNFLIGDVNLEYLLNETGTFRVNIFNESNQSNVIQDNNQGLFKQGIGINYQEDFTGFKNFKLFQYFFDLFRKSDDKRFPYKKNKKRMPVPPIDSKSISLATLLEE